MTIVVEVNVIWWGVNGEAWKWRRRLFAWEEELVGDCVKLLTSVVF